MNWNEIQEVFQFNSLLTIDLATIMGLNDEINQHVNLFFVRHDHSIHQVHSIVNSGGNPDLPGRGVIYTRQHLSVKRGEGG